ncbi:MAG: hypothetical protein A2535_08760 [Burkholderiales bacterium RIFOXYD2_FULL_59_8]|nr:MAG: hypothetical protein A2535_08760 [Burkholderiales bacterium RIFOXYD2_FULL_59_8]
MLLNFVSKVFWLENKAENVRVSAQIFQHSKWLRRLAGGVAAVLLWGFGWLVLRPWIKTWYWQKNGVAGS